MNEVILILQELKLNNLDESLWKEEGCHILKASLKYNYNKDN